MSGESRLAFSYLAFSTPQQADGRSDDRQHGAAQKWCEENGFTLALSRQYCDKGVSRYNGRARMKGALSRFLKKCGTPEVPAGSILIVEDFDRLSRENADDAWELFRGILLQDVEIVVLSLGRWFKRDSLQKFEDRLLVQACQHRAHQESATKAMRQRDIWADRRKRAGKGEGIHTNLPTWVRVGESGALELIPEREETIRVMVGWALSGVGCHRIARRLQSGPDARPCWLERGAWDAVAVQRILKWPAIWGAYQPRRLDEKRRLVPAGEVVRGHYPAVLKEEEAEAVRRAMSKRYTQRGRRTKDNRNVLRDVMRCAETGRALHYRTTHSGAKTTFVARAWQGSIQNVMPYAALEELVLRAVEEWTKNPDLLAGADATNNPGRTGELLRTLKEVEEDRAAIKHELDKPGRAATTAAIFAAQLDELDRREAEAKEALADQEAGRPVEAVLRSCGSVIEQLRALPAARQAEARVRLNDHLRELLSGVWVYRRRLTVQTGEVVVQVWPRAGQCKVSRVFLGLPPAGYEPLDVDGVDFREGYPARLPDAARPPRAKKRRD
jgi:DNA invertase Pin-like site-specific DNA recombinase